MKIADIILELGSGIIAVHLSMLSMIADYYSGVCLSRLCTCARNKGSKWYAIHDHAIPQATLHEMLHMALVASKVHE